MADNDIYHNKERYERFLGSLEDRILPEEELRAKRGPKYRYRIKNPVNIKYFRMLVPMFEANDLSYIHRIRQLQHLMVAAHFCAKDFADCDRDEINEIVAKMHTRLKSPKSKRDFIIYIRRVWKILFPELDEHGRIDDNVIPYPVRHLKSAIDKSKGTLRNDRITWEEFQQIVEFFGDDPRLQAYVMLATESLGRPQEILTRKIKDVELHDIYAKIWLTDHGKEGPGLLQCIDSFPYISRWLNQHPHKNNPEAPVFITLGSHLGKRITPEGINKHLRKACKALDINKRLTCYSLKRNGVTFRRLGGESDLEIQHAARWTSLRQLNTYDLSVQEDAFQRKLIKRGIIKPKDGQRHLQPKTKDCLYCGMVCGFSDNACSRCHRPLDKKIIKEEIAEKDQMKDDIEVMKRMLESFKRVLPEGTIDASQQMKPEAQEKVQALFGNLPV